jgi:hypothetical protein
MTDVFAPPTPWVTNFPGPDSRTQESIVSLSGTIGYYSDYTPWASPLLLLFVDTLDALKSFSVSNGGGLMTSSSAIPVGTAQSVAGPYVTGLIGGPIAAMQAVIGLADGRLFALTATQPGNVNAPPVWHYRLLGSF